MTLECPWGCGAVPSAEMVRHVVRIHHDDSLSCARGAWRQPLCDNGDSDGEENADTSTAATAAAAKEEASPLRNESGSASLVRIRSISLPKGHCPKRVTGTVTAFANGYGFIELDGSKGQVFVHHSAIAAAVAAEGSEFRRRQLTKGMRVSFIVEQAAKGPQAIDVRDEKGGLIEAALVAPTLDFNKRFTGTVVSFAKGYGFIDLDIPKADQAPKQQQQQQPRKVFVHNSAITVVEGQTVRLLAEGMRVSFGIEDSDKGVKATDVRGLKGEPIDCSGGKPKPATAASALQKAKKDKGWRASSRLKGTVAYWADSFGFINGEDGVRYFVHESELAMESDSWIEVDVTLNEGQRVEFDPAVYVYESDSEDDDADERPVAVNVTGLNGMPLYQGTVKTPKPTKGASQKKEVPKIVYDDYKHRNICAVDDDYAFDDDDDDYDYDDHSWKARRRTRR